MESEVAGLRDFLGSELYEWLQDDTLDTCDRLLQEVSDVYEVSDIGTAPALDLNRDRDALAQASPTLISSRVQNVILDQLQLASHHRLTWTSWPHPYCLLSHDIAVNWYLQAS